MRFPLGLACLASASLAGASAAQDPASPPVARRSLAPVLDRLAEARIASVLLEAEPLDAVDFELDPAAAEQRAPDGRTALFRLPVALRRDEEGSPAALAARRADGAPLGDVRIDVVPARVELLFKDHPDFKDLERASDVHGNRYVVFGADGEKSFDLVPPGFPCRLVLAAKLLGTRDDVALVGEEIPVVEVLLDGAPAGSIALDHALAETAFDLPPAATTTRVTLRVAGTVPQKGGMAMFKSFAIEARDGCDRVRVESGSALPRLAVRYPGAPPPALTKLFDASLDEEGIRETTRPIALIPGRMGVTTDPPQSFEVRVDGRTVGRAARGGEVVFESVSIGVSDVTIVAEQPLKGEFWLLQPRALYLPLRDPMQSLRAPTPFVRGLETEDGHPLLRHLMILDDSRRSLLAPLPTRAAIPARLGPGDRIEFDFGGTSLTDERLPRVPVQLEIEWVGGDGSRRSLWREEIKYKRRLRWESRAIDLPAGCEGDGELVFKTWAEGRAPYAMSDLLMAFAEPTIVRAQGPRRPNLLVYLVDTLRADHCSPWGYARDTTPALSRLAAEGIVFERAYAQAPWTRPSVATLFTSYLHTFHGSSKMTGLAPQLETMAERLRAGGYATAAFLANAHVHGESLNFEQGFGRFEAIEKTKQRGSSRADAVQEPALAWLEENADRPFFLYVHTIDPHAPYDPPERTAGVFGGGYAGPVDPARTNARELTDSAPLAPADLQHVLDLYDEEILFNDQEFAALCERLRELRVWDDTVVVVISDHGEEFFEHGGFGHGTVMWNEVLHVPLIVKLDRRDGDAPGGARVPGRVSVLDVLPTLLSRLGVDAPPAEFMGADLSGAFTGGEVPELPIFAEEFPDRRSLVAGNLKWIEYGPRCRRQRTWLFDLSADPFEQHDLSVERPEVARRMKDEFARLYLDFEERGFGHFESVVPQHLGAQDLEALRALGYIGDEGDEGDDAGQADR